MNNLKFTYSPPTSPYRPRAPSPSPPPSMYEGDSWIFTPRPDLYSDARPKPRRPPVIDGGIRKRPKQGAKFLRDKSFPVRAIRTAVLVYSYHSYGLAAASPVTPASKKRSRSDESESLPEDATHGSRKRAKLSPADEQELLTKEKAKRRARRQMDAKLREEDEKLKRQELRRQWATRIEMAAMQKRIEKFEREAKHEEQERKRREAYKERTRKAEEARKAAAAAEAEDAWKHEQQMRQFEEFMARERKKREEECERNKRAWAERDRKWREDSAYSTDSFHDPASEPLEPYQDAGYEKYTKKLTALKASSAPLTFDDIPWPTFIHTNTRPEALFKAENMRPFFFHVNRPGMNAKSRRDRIKRDLLLWHPDKFDTYVKRVVEKDRERVREGALNVARFLNQESQKMKA